MKTTKILSSFLALTLVTGAVSADQNNSQNRSAAPVRVTESQKKEILPAVIRHFEKLNFDARVEQQEYLRLKNGDSLFIDTLRHAFLGKDADIETVLAAMEVVALGRSAESLSSCKTIREAAEKCGFLRLCALMDFKKQKPDSYFLDGKNEFERGALAAEMMAFEEASHQFDLDKWIELKKCVMTENWHYDGQHPNLSVRSGAYAGTITRRAENRLKRERDNLVLDRMD